MTYDERRLRANRTLAEVEADRKERHEAELCRVAVHQERERCVMIVRSMFTHGKDAMIKMIRDGL